MTRAIRLTISPILGTVKLNVRFNIPRARLSDNTTHTVLRIIRELAANAIRHGHATELRIAGSLEGNNLRFSVRDNGCGFDPAHAPGLAQGHFGLQGIRERVASLMGDASIAPAPSGGMKATVCINVNADEDTETTE